VEEEKEKSNKVWEKWKTAVLRSGLPLEASVRRICESVGGFFQGEFEFPTTNEQGKLIHRSVDVDAWLDLPALKLQVLAECKLRRDGVQWLFLPELTPGRAESVAPATECLVSPFVPPWLLKGSSALRLPPLIRFWHKPRSPDLLFPVVGKGVEIRPGDAGSDPSKLDVQDDGSRDASNEVSIRTALMQVRLGAATAMFSVPSLIAAEFELYLYSTSRFVLPVIVTTASLFVLRSDAGFDEIRRSIDVASVARACPGLIITSPPPSSFRQHVHEGATAQFQRLAQSTWKRHLLKQRAEMFRRHGPNSSFVSLTASLPFPVLVVTLEHLPTFLRQFASAMSDVSTLDSLSTETLALTGAIAFDVKRHASEYLRRRSRSTPPS
jgi:hypothetical protein